MDCSLSAVFVDAPSRKLGMPTMTCPVDPVRWFYDALERGDVPRVSETLDENVEWTEAERFPYYTGTWQLPEAAFQNLLVRIANDWDGFAAAPFDFVSEGNRVVAFGTYVGTYKKTGRQISVPYAHVWTVAGRSTRQRSPASKAGQFITRKRCFGIR
jgi:ketosteroid isomerase-like protein